jgi:beta-barrel assembly-enhancing protease
VQHLNSYIAQNNLSGSNVGTDRLAPIKARLKK